MRRGPLNLQTPAPGIVESQITLSSKIFKLRFTMDLLVDKTIQYLSHRHTEQGGK